MSNVILFPSTLNTQPQASHSTNPIPKPFHEEESSVLSTKAEDQSFLLMLLQWPCFASFDKHVLLYQLLEKYYDDELNISQDYALEYMFHMNDPKSAFDVANALYAWNDEDRSFFLLSLNIHTDLIKQVKKEELS
ncbi:MAG: hypothetical protein CMP11_03940 [Zetaproteobacteria bacterium]|nr:hypothetical protein [Pseudobdellovibrionaceae bacterium]|tara:strand:+ start:1067 stop:1471 length:405 start_codon:yes stop_codon:yes gene_type:complete